MKYIIVQAKVLPTPPRRTWAGVHHYKRRLPLQWIGWQVEGNSDSRRFRRCGCRGNDVTALALLGYDPRKIHAGPAPFEAIGQGIAVGEHDVVFRCSMVTLRAGMPGTGTNMDVKKLAPSVILDDAGAAGLEDDDARELIEAINEQLGSNPSNSIPGQDTGI